MEEKQTNKTQTINETANTKETKQKTNKKSKTRMMLCLPKTDIRTVLKTLFFLLFVFISLPLSFL